MKSVLSLFAILVALVAIGIGVVAKTNPILFFKIPNVGFIFWAVTGGKMPPYIHEEMWKDPSWLKDGDVIVSTGVKAGTTWMLYTAHLIRTKGDEERYPFTDPALTTPWPGLIQEPGDDWNSTLEKMNTMKLKDGTPYKQYWDNPDYPFRIFKSHDHPHHLGNLVGGKKVKILAMTRNGLDTVASFTPFFEQHTQEFRNLWGGFPPIGKVDLQEEARDRMAQLSPGGIFENQYFGYVNNWWKVRHEENVLLLHYSDVKKDLAGTIDKLAKFYGVDLTDEEKSNIVHKASFEQMKKNAHWFAYTMPLNPNFEGTAMQVGSMTRKGIVGDGKIMFPPEEQAKWAKAEEEMFGDDPQKLEWARHGCTSFDMDSPVTNRENLPLPLAPPPGLCKAYTHHTQQHTHTHT